MNQFRDFVKSELLELETKDLDLLFELIKENCEDGGIIFNGQLEDELYSEIDFQLGLSK